MERLDNGALSLIFKKFRFFETDFNTLKCTSKRFRIAMGIETIGFFSSSSGEQVPLFLQKLADVNKERELFDKIVAMKKNDASLDLMKQAIKQGAKISLYVFIKMKKITKEQLSKLVIVSSGYTSPISFLATNSDYSEILDMLLYFGADIHAADSNGYQLIHKCAFLGAINCAKVLLAKDPQLINTQSKVRKETPLHCSIRYTAEKCQQFSKWLIAQGADISLLNSSRQTPVHVLCKNWIDSDPTELLCLLQKKGGIVDANAKTLLGNNHHFKGKDVESKLSQHQSKSPAPFCS